MSRLFCVLLLAGSMAGQTGWVPGCVGFPIGSNWEKSCLKYGRPPIEVTTPDEPKAGNCYRVTNDLELEKIACPAPNLPDKAPQQSGLLLGHIDIKVPVNDPAQRDTWLRSNVGTMSVKQDTEGFIWISESDGEWEKYEDKITGTFSLQGPAPNLDDSKAPMIQVDGAPGDARGITFQNLNMPEPMDVPAITERRKQCINWDFLHATLSGPTCREYGEVATLTCADKSRFLMESVDGKHHCLKF